MDHPAHRILRLTFDRPETFNSVDAQTRTQLTNIWRDINDDPDINAVIVTGAGKAFSAGGDFELIKGLLDDRVAPHGDLARGERSRLQRNQLQQADYFGHQRCGSWSRARRWHPRGVSICGKSADR
jgi:enoyl-CoA hydratase/carnithine racemase